MLINLKDVFTSEGKQKKVSIPFEKDSITYMGKEYSILKKSNMDISFQNTGIGKLLMQASMSLLLKMQCDRCLQSINYPLNVQIKDELLYQELLDDFHEEASDLQDYLQDYQLDTIALMDSELIINMPVKVLCRDDCKGICKQCGQNLNEKECNCDTFVPDPRMAAIKDIFNANKEV